MSWLASIALVLLLTWTLLPGGLTSLTWTGGYKIGHRLAKKAFSNPSGRKDDLEKP